MFCGRAGSRLSELPDALRQGRQLILIEAQLLEHCGVVVTPGSGFGEAGRDWLRLALVRPVAELEAAVARLTPWWQQQC